MARIVILAGTPGEVWKNRTGKVWYQRFARWANTCGECAQYDHAIAVHWALPAHRMCNCWQVVIAPGAEAAPFVDFMEEVRALDPIQRRWVVGKANMSLIEAGVVSWDDVVLPNRIRELREVVARKGLTIEAMTRAGVEPGVARRAFESARTGAEELAESKRKDLLGQVAAKGLERKEHRRAVAERLEKELGLKAGRKLGPAPKLPIPTPSLPDLTLAEIAKAYGIDPRKWEAKVATVPKDIGLGEFAARVRDAATGISGAGRFGRGKVFIADAHQAYEMKYGPIPLAEFKHRLAEANNARHLDLGRADMTPAIDPERLQRSETRQMGAEFHFVRVPEID